MKAAAAVLLCAFLTEGALAQSAPPHNSAAQGAYAARRAPESGYHVAYTRRGCRVEENWDGTQYSASVRCAPGVRPN